MKDLISKAFATCLMLERGHTLLKSVSPQYDEFCTETKNKIYRKLKVKQTIDDVVTAHMGGKYHLHFFNHGHKRQSMMWYCSRYRLSKIFKTASADLNYGMIEGIVLSALPESSLNSGWSVPIYLAKNPLAQMSQRYFSGDPSSLPEDTTREYASVPYPEQLILSYNTKNEPTATLIFVTKEQLVNLIHFSHGEKCSQTCTEMTKFYEEAQDRRGLVHFSGESKYISNNSKSENQVLTRQEILVDPTLTLHCRKEVNADFSLYSDSVQRNLVDDINRFIDKSKEFAPDKNRRYLLVGSPGTGKTSLIKKLIRNLPITYTPIIIYPNFISTLPFIDKDLSPMFIVIEDIDLLVDKSWELQTLLQFLDGLGSSSGAIVLMTTNYPEKLPDTILDRHGRVDKIVELTPADHDLRKKQVGSIFPAMDPEEFSRATEGFTFAQYKELDRRIKIFNDEDWKASVEDMKEDIRRRKEYKNVETKSR